MIEDLSKASLLALLLGAGTVVYYPGPFFSKISGWSIVFQAASGNRHLHALKEHEKYGDIVRIGPDNLSINSIAALKEIYVSRKTNVIKSEWYRTLSAPSKADSTHTEIDRHTHAFRRRVLDHAFSDNALKSAETFIVKNIRRWAACLGPQGAGTAKEKSWSESRDMATWASYLGYDVMGDLAFGDSFNMAEKEEYRYLPGAMLNGSFFLYVYGYLPCVKLLRPLLGTKIMDFLGGELNRDMKRFTDYAAMKMDKRIAAEKARAEKPGSQSIVKDFAYFLVDAKDPETGKGFTTQQLHADSVLLIAAGSDTSSISMAGTFFYFMRYPGVLAKATNEVRSAFQSVDEIHGNSVLNVLPYLRACIDETLRMSPPVPGHLPREVLPGGLNIEGEHIPEGMVVGTAAYAIHHKEEYFPESWVYRPERWIPDSMPGVTKESVALARDAFCPFSLGSRGCVGKRVAYLELTLALATVLFSYDIKKVSDSATGKFDAATPGRERADEFQMQDFFVGDRDGPVVQFKARDGVSIPAA